MPTIDHHAAIKVLAAVRGHPFDRNAFAALFDGMADISVTFVDQPAAAMLMRPGLAQRFDALLLYDMPGIDFAADPPGSPIGPDDETKRGLRDLLDAGIGVVALHHALAGWPGWPEYAPLLGGRFLYRQDGEISDSGYRHAVSYRAQVAADHPITNGLPASFDMTDELYLAETFEDDVIPLLRADHDFTAANFYSATRAIEGQMFSNEDWTHAPGSNLIGWAKCARRSPLVYLQPGDDEATYSNPNYRRLVENAIRWVASVEARAWATNT